MARRSLAKLKPLIGMERFEELMRTARSSRRELGGRAIWNISSTSQGGGVAEMLQVLVGYTLDAGFDVHWLVMTGDPDFFAITKRIHNHLHGVTGDGGGLDAGAVDHYTRVTNATAQAVLSRVQRGDVVLLHDPQTAGLAEPLAEAGIRVVWRCHVGHEETNEWTDQAWTFLRPHLTPCAAYVFSVRAYAPTWMDRSKVWVIPPSIDPFSPKNEDIDRDGVVRALRRIGILGGEGEAPPATFTRCDGTMGYVERRATILSEEPRVPLSPDIPFVVQVSRWDRLKDMTGVMQGFASFVAGRVDAHLALVGPATNGVSDDPEELAVFNDCLSTWGGLSAEARRCIWLVTLPMDDMEENAAMVNAIQRHATVIVQKSLAEGFGLTVTEAMWKSKAVIASGIGGMATQIDSDSGLLLKDPNDLSEFGHTLADLLARPDVMADLGARAHERALEAFVGDEHLKRLAHLLMWLITG